MIVHSELDRHEGWFERQYVATEALPHRLLDHLLLRGFVRGEKLFFIRVRSLPQPGSVTAPANVSKSQLPGRVTRQGVGLDVSRVKPLLGDAVAKKNHAVTVANLEVPARRARCASDGNQQDASQSVEKRIHS